MHFSAPREPWGTELAQVLWRKFELVRLVAVAGRRRSHSQGLAMEPVRRLEQGLVQKLGSRLLEEWRVGCPCLSPQDCQRA